jgi:hypothetical protein
VRLRESRASLVAAVLVMPITAPRLREHAATYDQHVPSTYDAHVLATGPLPRCIEIEEGHADATRGAVDPYSTSWDPSTSGLRG